MNDSASMRISTQTPILCPPLHHTPTPNQTFSPCPWHSHPETTATHRHSSICTIWTCMFCVSLNNPTNIRQKALAVHRILIICDAFHQFYFGVICPLFCLSFWFLSF